MEEDIKILEEFITDWKDSKRPFFSVHHVCSLENLLKRYKELEEENKNLSKDYYDLGSNFCDLDEKCKNSIPISVIQNKIDELEEDLKDFEQTDNTGRFKREKSRDYDKLLVLQELLEERNK